MNRVLIFSLSYYPHVGGAEVAIKEITDRIAQEDIEFHMVTMRFDKSLQCEELIGNIHVHRVGFGNAYISKILFVLLAAFRVRTLNKKLHFNALWAMMTYMLMPITLSRLFGIRVPYILTLQDGDPFKHVFNRLRILPFRLLLTYGFKHAAAVQAISTFLAYWATQAGFRGVPEIIPNGVDTARFTHIQKKDTIHAVKKLNKKDGDIYLVTTSRLVEKNAVDDIIRALVLLPKEISFLIYGTGPDEKKLRMLASGSGVESRVRFMGYVDHAHLPTILNVCDIFVRPSRSEGMGNSFIEAMAIGLPIIATQEGGIADFLFDSKRNPGIDTTGWAVDKNSPEQIANAVKDILANPQIVARVVTAAKNLVFKKYDWNIITKQMRALLNKVCTTPT